MSSTRCRLTLGVAEAAVADAGAAPPLHGLQVLVVPEVSLLHRRREVFDHRVELAQRVVQIRLVDELRCRKTAEEGRNNTPCWSIPPTGAVQEYGPTPRDSHCYYTAKLIRMETNFYQFISFTLSFELWRLHYSSSDYPVLSVCECVKSRSVLCVLRV